jgi:thioesterase domain-containing protein
MSERAAITAALHAQLPMTAFLHIAVAELAPGRVVLAAPLGPSRNHRGTGFGPALFTAAALAPWLVLIERAWAARLAVQILLGRCDFAINRAVTGDYRVRCDDVPVLDGAAIGRGERLQLSAGSVVVIDDGAPAASYRAHYTLVPADGAAGDLVLPFPESWRA